MKSNNENILKTNEKFKNDLHILLIGYLNYAFSLENLKNPTSQKSYKKVLINGLKISSKYLGEISFLTQKFMQYYNKSSNLVNFTSQNNLYETEFQTTTFRNNETERPEKTNFFLKNSYFPKQFKISSKSKNFSKTNKFQRSTDADFFRNTYNNDNSASETENYTERKTFKKHVKEIQFAISDLKKIREEYQNEKTLIENEKNYQSARPYNNSFFNQTYQKPFLMNTPISFKQNFASFKNSNTITNPNLYSSPKGLSQEGMNSENKLKKYIATLEEENEKLKKQKKEENIEFNNMKEYLKQLEIEKNLKNENTFPNFNSEIKIYPNSSPISNISGLVGVKKIVSQKFDDHYLQLINDSHNNHQRLEEKLKSVGKYSNKASRNFKLNLEKILKTDDTLEEDEVLQRKAKRFEQDHQVINTNFMKNSNSIQTLKKPNPKLLRSTASFDIRAAAEKNSSKSSLPSQGKIEDFNEEIFDFFGISNKEKFLQNCSLIVMNNAKKEVYNQYLRVGDVDFMKVMRIIKEKDILVMKISLYKNDENNAVCELTKNFGDFLEYLKNFDLRDIYSGFFPIKTIRTCEDFVRFCVFPFISVRKIIF